MELLDALRVVARQWRWVVGGPLVGLLLAGPRLLQLQIVSALM